MKVVLGFALLLAQVIPTMQIAPPAFPVSPSNATQGIGVTGTGTASAPATSAQVTIMLNATQNAAMTRESLQPIVDAIKRAGGTNIIEPVYTASAARFNSASVTFTVDHPTPEKIQNGVQMMGTTIAQGQGINLSQAQVLLRLADCSAVAAQAQREALRRARANADSIAQQLGIHVGAVISVDSRSFGVSSQGDCETQYSVGPYMPQPMALDDYTRVKVTANVSVRYAIKK